MNLSGAAAAKSLSGENDLAQNPFDLGAEYGPSLFDARHRSSPAPAGMPRVSSRRAQPCVPCSEAGRSTACDAQFGNTVHRVRHGERGAPGEQPADLRLCRSRPT